MQQEQDAELTNYPHGRGYGHDYMRGGEVLGGYGYSQRAEYTRTRGEINSLADGRSPQTSGDPPNPVS